MIVTRSCAHKLRRALDSRRTYPSRSMIVRANGSIYWPQPGEGVLPGEVLLAPYEHDGSSWDVFTLRAALKRSQS